MKENKVAILIQGPTNYVDSIIKCYSSCHNVFWTTWIDEPPENLEKIKKSNIKLYCINKPKHFGYRNVNLQCCSTLACLDFAQETNPDIEYYIKIRSDIIINDINSFKYESLKTNRKIAFIGWADYNEGFYLDYVVFGEDQSLRKYFNWEDTEDSGYPFPERYLQMNIANLINIENNGWMNHLINLDSIIIFWLSRKKNIKIIDFRIKYNTVFHLKERLFRIMLHIKYNIACFFDL